MPTKKAQPRWTNKDLDREFKRLNKKYFGGKLDPVYVEFRNDLPIGKVGLSKAYRTMFKCAGDRYGIRITDRLQDSWIFWMSTLIHEMVHVEQRNRYTCGCGNGCFNKRIKELVAAGAYNGIL